MSRSLHFISKTISVSGYASPDGRCLPCSGVSGRAVCVSPKIVSDVKFPSLICAASSRHNTSSSVCNATSSYNRRNQDNYSRQNKNTFSRNRNSNRPPIEDRADPDEDLEEPETFSNKNESLLSVSEFRKYQATPSPGPREKEIVELFRKVQAQLRQRAAMKEERKEEDSREKSKESETVDSLLKLLRKHSVQPGRKNTTIGNNNEFILDQTEPLGSVPSTEPSVSESNNTVKNDIQERPSPHPSRPRANFRKNTNVASNKDFTLDQLKQVGPGPSNDVKETSFMGSNGTVKNDIKESPIPSPNLSRPKSNFRKRSPVPEIKFQPVYPVPIDNLDNKVVIESNVGPTVSEGNMRDEILEDETNEIHESEHDDGAEEGDVVETVNLSGMKLTELRALAKSRGMKGFSKLKKSELVDLLSASSF